MRVIIRVTKIREDGRGFRCRVWVLGLGLIAYS